MKPIPVLLICSLVANAALVGVLVALRDVREAPSSGGDAAGVMAFDEAEEAVAAPVGGEPTVAAVSEAVRVQGIPRVDARDVRGTLDRFLEAGWPEADARRHIVGTVMAEALERLSLVQASREEVEYWKSTGGFGAGISWEEQEEMMKSYFELQDLAGTLYGGKGAGPMWGMGSWPEDMPEGRRRELRQLELDYQIMQAKVHAESGGMMMSEDRELLAFLEEERRAELEALLTPEELFEYEVRGSPTAMQMRHELAVFEPTEEEFREIFRMRREMNLDWQPGMAPPDEEEQALRVERQQAMDAGLRELLGEARYEEYERSRDWEYRNLVNLTQRLDIPREAANHVYELREFYQEEAMELRMEQDLTSEERSLAMEALRTEATRELEEVLGERGLEAYRNSGGHWMRTLQ